MEEDIKAAICISFGGFQGIQTILYWKNTITIFCSIRPITLGNDV